jgi:hypothetical protein
MRRIFSILASTLILTAGVAKSTDLSLPPRPETMAYPTPDGYLRFYATNVSRMDDGTTLVQYGFLFGKLNGHVLMVLENSDHGLVCRGETGRKDWPVNRSVVACTRDGVPHSRSDMTIEGKRSRSPIGQVSSAVLDANGRKIGNSVLRWNPFDFPEAR